MVSSHCILLAGHGKQSLHPAGKLSSRVFLCTSVYRDVTPNHPSIMLLCASVAPHTTRLEARAWRPTIPEKPDSQRDSAPSGTGIAGGAGGPGGPGREFALFGAKPDNGSMARVFSDDVMSTEDVRYWGAASVHDLESAVLSDRHNSDLWLRLAYRKLHCSKL